MAPKRRTRHSQRTPKFERECGCIHHDTFTEGKPIILRKVTDTISRRAAYQALVEKKVLSRRCKYICVSCLEYSKLHFCKTNIRESANKPYTEDANREGDSEHGDEDTEQEEENSQQGEEDPEQEEEDTEQEVMDTDENRHGEVLDSILRSLQQIPNAWHNFNNDERHKLAKIAKQLGSIIELDLYTDSIKVTKQTKTMTDATTDKNEWFTKRNSLLLGFVTGCTNISLQSASHKKINAVIHTVEQVLNARNLLTISPFAFQRNVVQYTVTGSKLATNLMGTWEPAGAYTRVQNYIHGPADPPIIPEGDVHIAVDNEQRVGFSSGRIREGSSVRVDICTTMSCLQTAQKEHLQEKIELKPGEWRKRDSDEMSKLVDNIDLEEESSMRVFRQYRQDFINELILDVETGRDHIDIAMAQQDTGGHNFVCSKCKFVNADIGVCGQCGHDPNQHSMNYDIYYRTPSKHPENPPKITIAEPCMVNPCSKKAVKTVLDHVREHTKTGDDLDRKWTYVWCDAVPYLLGSKVQEENQKCNICGDMVTNVDMNTHQETKHTDQEQQFEMWFSDIFLRPGPGHIELNMARCIMKLLWHPYIQHFAVLLGFKSPRAQDSIHNGVDHHRSRQIISTLLNSLAKELIKPYKEHCQTHNQPCSAEHYMDWVESEVQDPNYHFAWHVTFSYLLAFQLYTESVRKNNHEHMMAARAAFAPLFFGRNHPMYRELHVRDMLDRVQCPQDLKDNISTTETFTASGVAYKGQGADFIHEETNKKIKGLLPPGAVTEETWRRVCRKTDHLHEMKSECVRSSGVDSISGSKPPKRHDHEETMMRRELRQANLFQSPLQSQNLASLTKSNLDYDIPNIAHTVKLSYKEYKQELVQAGKFGGLKIKRKLYITPEERIHGESIERKTKDEIKAEIVRLANELEGTRFAKQIHQLKSNTKKDAYIELYNEVVEAKEIEEMEVQVEEPIEED